MIQAQDIKQWIQQNLPQAEVEVTGADGVHFEARVICPSFTGKPTIARHRMVYQALGDRMQADIHALALQTMTPQEWKEKQTSH